MENENPNRGRPQERVGQSPDRRSFQGQAPERQSRQRQAAYRQVRVVGLAMFLPFMMVSGPVVGYLLGDWIAGSWLGGAGWARFAGLGLGLAASIHQTVKIIQRLIQEMK